ncbi:MAG: hypothetical protein PSX36_16005 [bacterium]|nr:hypothetical protein [bacterium]
MPKTATLILPLIALVLITSNCGSPECKTSNNIFATYSPDTKVYKDELVNQLTKTDQSKLTYWMSAYWSEPSTSPGVTEHIRVHLKGEDLCADMILDIKDSRKGIENVLKNKMLGYKGAEFKGLKFDTYQDSSKTEFIFREVSGIRD